MIDSMRRSLAAIPVLLVLVLAGCSEDGSGGGSASTDGAILNAPEFSQQEIIQAAGLTTEDGISYTSPDGCQVAVILDSPNAVNTYASAGDTVVTNPSASAGVKVVGGPPGCLDTLARDLKALDR
jgi:hypothetical protein